MTRAPVIDHDRVLELMAQGATVVDALPPDEYAKQHLPGAINIPVQDFAPDDVAGLDRQREIVTYCADSQCDLSARAAARLLIEGFQRVYEFVGGIADWGAYGLEFEGENDVVRAGHLCARDLPACSPDTLVREIRFGVHELTAVVDDEGVLLGRIRRDEAASAGDAKARDVMSPKMSTFRPDVYISEMGDWFKRRPHAEEFIITTPDGRVFGVLYRSAVEHLLQELQQHGP